MTPSSTTNALSAYQQPHVFVDVLALDMQQMISRHGGSNQPFHVVWFGIIVRRAIAAAPPANLKMPKDVHNFIDIADALFGMH